MTHTQKMQEQAWKEFETTFGKNLNIDQESFNQVYLSLHLKPAIKRYLDTLIARVVRETEEMVRKEIVEWATRERTARSMDEDGHPQDYYIDYDDLTAFLTQTTL